MNMETLKRGSIVVLLMFMLSEFQPVLADYFGTGQDLMDLLKSENQNKKMVGMGYIQGVINGVGAGAMMYGHTQQKQFLCASPAITLGQVAEVVKRYLENHPEQWHKPTTNIIVDAVQETWPCPKPKGTK